MRRSVRDDDDGAYARAGLCLRGQGARDGDPTDQDKHPMIKFVRER